MDKLLTLVTYSHSDYKDLWPIILDGVSKNPIPICKVFACNTKPDNDKPILDIYNKIVFYDDFKTFPEKVIQCLEQIQTPYVLFVHDIDIFIHFDSNALNKIMSFVSSENVDRFILGAIKPNQMIIDVDGILITPINGRGLSDHFYTPYDVGPSIWNVKTFIEGLESVKTVSYREIEDSSIQSFLLGKKVYANTNHINKPKYKSIYQLGRPFPDFCSFLHIVIRGKFLPSHFYHDLETVFLELIKTHNIDMEKRGINKTHGLIIVNRTV